MYSQIFQGEEKAFRVKFLKHRLKIGCEDRKATYFRFTEYNCRLKLGSDGLTSACVYDKSGPRCLSAPAPLSLTMTKITVYIIDIYYIVYIYGVIG